jgi:LPS export ABC transporter protein LptC
MDEYISIKAELTPSSGNARQLAGVAVILLAAIAGLVFRWEPEITPVVTQTEASKSLPDTIVGLPLLDIFDDNGKKIRQLRGQKMDYFDTDKHSIVTAPTAGFEKQNGDQPPTPWQLTADTATIYQSNNRLDLQGNVRLWSDTTRGGRTEILTEQLLVDTVRQFAETDKAVTIRARSSESTALGMQADLANERLLLPSRVKEIHEVRR